jgi:hypothetical protein
MNMLGGIGQGGGFNNAVAPVQANGAGAPPAPTNALTTGKGPSPQSGDDYFNQLLKQQAGIPTTTPGSTLSTGKGPSGYPAQATTNPLIGVTKAIMGATGIPGVSFGTRPAQLGGYVPGAELDAALKKYRTTVGR